MEQEPLILKLYITGQTPHSLAAMANLRRLCAQQAPGRCQIEIIDVESSPHLAEVDHIIATPTLIRCLPSPLQYLIGDLSEEDQVIRSLDLKRTVQRPRLEMVPRAPTAKGEWPR